jgi:hypothetical protein
LRTYSEFESYLKDFAAGRYPFLWAVGRPGTGKSGSIRAATQGQDVYYRQGGQLTPLQFYLDCYEYQGRPIILDDAEHILENRLGAKLISALGDTTPEKQLSYGTTSPALDDVPPVFKTTSPLCIIANKATANPAIQSRAVTLDFDPTNVEIHRAVARWFWDQEIHDWMGQHISRLEPFDTRWYVIADHDKRAGRDWKSFILEGYEIDRASRIVQDLERDNNYPAREAKAARFLELMEGASGASRASYFRLRRRLKEDGRLATTGVEPIPLTRTSPPVAPTEPETDALAVQEEALPPPKEMPPEHLSDHEVLLRALTALTLQGAEARARGIKTTLAKTIFRSG